MIGVLYKIYLMFVDFDLCLRQCLFGLIKPLTTVFHDKILITLMDNVFILHIFKECFDVLFLL